MENKKSLINDRVIYLDILRILAIIAVIMIHVSASSWYYKEPSSFEWNVFNVYDSIVRWAVPIFVMISGAIFLDNKREINTKKLYTKNIFRIIIAFVFWSLFYSIVNYFLFDVGKNNIKLFIKNVILGHYHLWFLYMIIGLYIITPVLRKITLDKKTTEYFLIISIFFSFIFPTLLKVPIFSGISEVFKNIDLNFGYITYFVMGYYLSTKEISKKIRKIIYALSFVGFAVTIFGSAIIACRIGKPYGLYDAFNINVLLQTIGVFVFVKNLKIDITPKLSNTINLLAKYSFGIYLVHDFIIIMLKQNGITTLSFNAILSVPVIGMIVFVISLIISVIINHIPILKKYIV